MAFSTPRFDMPIDVDAHLAALPADAKTKGIYLSDPIKRAEKMRPGVDPFEEAGLKRRRIQTFFDYPYADFIRLLVACAKIVWPTVSTGEAARRFGKACYENVFNAHFGRVLLAAVDNDINRIASAGVRLYGISNNFGEVTYEEMGPGKGIYRFRDMPALLETYHVGIIEGTLKACGLKGIVEIDLHDLGNADVYFEV